MVTPVECQDEDQLGGMRFRGPQLRPRKALSGSQTRLSGCCLFFNAEGCGLPALGISRTFYRWSGASTPRSDDLGRALASARRCATDVDSGNWPSVFSRYASSIRWGKDKLVDTARRESVYFHFDGGRILVDLKRAAAARSHQSRPVCGEHDGNCEIGHGHSQA